MERVLSLFWALLPMVLQEMWWASRTAVDSSAQDMVGSTGDPIILLSHRGEQTSPCRGDERPCESTKSTQPDSEPEPPSRPPPGALLPARALIPSFSLFLRQRRFCRPWKERCGLVAVFSRSKVLSQSNFIFIVSQSGRHSSIYFTDE